MSAHNAHDILKDMVGELAKSGTSKERLTHAVLEKSYVRIDKYKLPPALQQSFDITDEKLTAVAGKGLEATFAASINAMSEEDAQKIIDDIVFIAFITMREYGASSKG